MVSAWASEFKYAYFNIIVEYDIYYTESIERNRRNIIILTFHFNFTIKHKNWNFFKSLLIYNFREYIIYYLLFIIYHYYSYYFFLSEI